MAEFKNNGESWNEFQWEKEIRRDERRISCYFRELPGCLDLPGEEEMIFSTLLSSPDLVPTGGNPDSLRFWQRPDEDDEEYEDSDDPPGAVPAPRSSRRSTGLRPNGTSAALRRCVRTSICTGSASSAPTASCWPEPRISSIRRRIRPADSRSVSANGRWRT